MKSLFFFVFSGLIMAAFAGSAEADFVITHTGSTDPTTEGFAPRGCCGPSTVGPISNDLGRDAWSITGLARSSQYGYYSGALSPAQRADIASHGFVLTFNARVLQGLAPVYDAVNYVVIASATVFDIGSRRFDVQLGLDANGDTVAVLPTSIDAYGPGGSIRAPGPSYTLTGSGNSYHTYQLVYNPTTQLADLFVDGVNRIQGYAGHTSGAFDLGLVWGAWSGGQGNFDFVQVASSQKEPCPTASVTGSGAGYVTITVSDTCAGLVSVTASCTNCTTNAPGFVSGCPDSVSVTATKIDLAQSARVTVTAASCGGGSPLVVDPVSTTLKINTGRSVIQTFKDIPQSEHFIAVTNGDPGLRVLVIQVNGKPYRILLLRDNMTRTIDVAAAMRPGNSNTLTFSGYGQTGASADIFVSDMPPPRPQAKAFSPSGAPLERGTWGRLADASEDNRAQQVARSSHQQIQLQLATALDRHTATNPGLYTVHVNDIQVRVKRVVVAKQGTQGATLLLTLPDGTLQAGDKVRVIWERVENAQGQPLFGHVSLVAE